jgi:hypothetical protein
MVSSIAKARLSGSPARRAHEFVAFREGHTKSPSRQSKAILAETLCRDAVMRLRGMHLAPGNPFTSALTALWVTGLPLEA